MPESFSFVLPDPLSLSDTQTIIEPASLSPEKTSFFDILNKLIYGHYNILLDLRNYSFMLDWIKEIWDNNAPTPLPFIISQLPPEQSYLHDLIPLIIQARSQTIENHKKMDFSKEENIFKYITETDKRIRFFFNIESIFPLKTFSKTSPKQRYDFFIGLFDDIINNIQNISNGLFEKYFTTHFNALKAYMEHAKNVKNSLIKKLIETNDTIDNVDCILAIWKLTATTSVFSLKYHFALGNDDIEFQYLNPNTAENILSLITNPELKEKLEKVIKEDTEKFEELSLQQFEQLFTALQTDNTRKMYIKLRACFNDKDEKGKINTQGNTLTFPLENVLKEHLAQLEKHTEVNNKNFNLIQNSIFSLGFAYEQNYKPNTKNVNLCSEIIMHLRRILQNDKGSIIVFDIDEHLAHHKEKIDALVIEQDTQPKEQSETVENPTKKLYVSLLSYFTKSQTIDAKDASYKEELHLEKKLSTAHTITPREQKIIEEAITYLNYMSEKSYDNSLEKTALCIKGVDMLCRQLRTHDKESTIASELYTQLIEHKKSILSEQSEIKKEIEKELAFLYPKDKEFSFYFPRVRSQITNFPLYNTSKISIFEILNEIIVKHGIDFLNISIEQCKLMQATLKSIWNNEKNIPTSENFIKLLNEKTFIKKFVSLILEARFQVIDAYKKQKQEIDLLSYLEENQKRFNFIILIAKLIGDNLKNTELVEEHNAFMFCIICDSFNSTQTISNAFSQYMIIDYEKLQQYYLEATDVRDTFVPKTISFIQENEKIIPNSIDLLFEAWMYSTRTSLQIVKYYYSLGKDELACSFINKPIRLPACFSGAKKAKFDILLQETEKLKTIIEKSNPKRKLCLRLLDTLMKSVNKTNLVQMKPEDLELEFFKKINDLNDETIPIIEQHITFLCIEYKKKYLQYFSTCKIILKKLMDLLVVQYGNIVPIQMRASLYQCQQKIEQTKPDTDLKLSPNEDMPSCVTTELNPQDNELTTALARLEEVKAQKLKLEAIHMQLKGNHTQTATHLEAIKSKIEALKVKKTTLEKEKAFHDAQLNKNKQQKQNVKTNIRNLQHANDSAEQQIETSKTTLQSLEDKLKRLKTQRDALLQTSIAAEKQQAAQLEKEKADQHMIQKLKLENEDNERQAQANKQNTENLEKKLKKATTRTAALQAKKQTLIEKNTAEIAELQEKLQKRIADFQPFKNQHTALRNEHERVSKELTREYEYIPIANNANHQSAENLNKDLEGFMNICNTLRQDRQLQCQQPLPTQLIPEVTYTPPMPVAYIPSRQQLVCAPLHPVSAEASAALAFQQVVNFSSNIPKPSTG